MNSFSVPDLTLRQIQIFWSVAHAGSMTKAAKQLDMRQPSVSQQLSKMEHVLGGKLIRFVNAEMRLTPAGEYLLAEAAQILGAFDRTKAGLLQIFQGRPGRLVVGALPSLARNLLMPSFQRLLASASDQFLDIVETTPREAIEQLNGRLIDIAVISGYAAVTKLSPGLQSIFIGEDAQLLAVPESLPDLAGAVSPERELAASDAAILNRTIRYAFGSDHTNRLDMWYDHLLPESVMAARCRSYETALPFVELGIGTALIPDLALQQQGRQIFGAALYEIPVPRRQTIALFPHQYGRQPGIQTFIDLLREVFASTPRLSARPAPPFAVSRLASLGHIDPSVTARPV
ncbi:MAG: LysR family transcriptional regulator [Rhizobiales bacterium]|nr:LysR family transcriptional regulator [Hyphomicrobiales bacterium]